MKEILINFGILFSIVLAFTNLYFAMKDKRWTEIVLCIIVLTLLVCVFLSPDVKKAPPGETGQILVGKEVRQATRLSDPDHPS